MSLNDKAQEMYDEGKSNEEITDYNMALKKEEDREKSIPARDDT
jgi:hypothetical protein